MTTSLIRLTLWVSAPANVLVGVILAFPASAPGRLLELPAPVPPLYAGLGGFMVCLFGGAYAWLARQPELDRPLVAVGALGKGGFFTLTLALFLAGNASTTLVALASGDAVLAALWAWWLVRGDA